ncbi:hypothetical protein Sste5346_006013 [Sporothrix stenoceras]|uniref:Erythromycin esterase n=1 Tax=Sporothrix stenoceras TaxID=5173 RepID=A0ABR3Z1R4_9PEZI
MAPLTRRRSARLASNSKPTGVAATPDLDPLTEQIEEQPSSPVMHAPQTPAGTSPVKPSKSEMRPGKANGAVAPPSSALRLGFTDIGDASRLESPTTAKNNKIAASATMKAVLPEDGNETPSKKRSPLSSISPFTFRFSRLKGKTSTEETASEAAGFASTAASPSKATGTPDLGLSDEARRLMEELREEAQKIRADLEVEREQERAREEEDIANGRKIAKPKSRAGRYSAAHTAEFSKMDSIANHPSAFRASRYTPVKSTATPSAAATPAISTQARGLKRTQSKANLDETPRVKTTRTPAAVPSSAAAASVSPAKRAYNPLFGNDQSHGGIDNKPPQSARKGNLLFPPANANDSPQQPISAAKRIKQNIGDDASSSRPVSRDGSSLPRPAGLASSVSSLSRSHTTASLLTPTKASSSLARSTSVRTPGTSTATTTAATANTSSHLQHKTPTKTPSKTPMQLFSTLKRSATTSSLQTSVRTPPAASTVKTVEAEKPNVSKPAASKPTPIMSRAIGSIKKTTAPTFATARGPAQPNTSTARSVIPVTTSFGPTVMAFSKTPAPPRMADRVMAPRVPATTPRRKLAKRVTFTPGTARAVMSEKSPSLFRSGIPRSALKNTGAQDSDMQVDGKDEIADSPSVRRRLGTTIYYPDLSGHELLRGSSGSDVKEEKGLSPVATLAPPTAPPPSVPGTFTFRSDKTINFGQTSPTGFGSSPGQASLRQVRSSTSAVPKIPGSFPGGSHVGDVFQALVATEGSNKENARPVAIIPHGITNKKRHRVSEAEEEAEEEAAQRAAKKRKNAPVPEGEALLAPRLVGKTVPPSTAGGNSTFGGMRSSPHKMMSPQKSALHKTSPSKTMTPQKTVTFSAAPSASKTPVAGKTPGSAAAKKRPILSMSRLNSLARPKLRK